jgi:HSP20 family molecular chaperone IbpA
MRYRRISYRYTEVVTHHAVRLLGDPWGLLLRTTVARPEWKPPADLYETDDAYVVKVELAGVAEDDLDVSVYTDALVVEGSRAVGVTGEVRYHSAEIRYGPFRLEVAFPTPINRERVSARCESGFLLMTVGNDTGGGS